MTTLPRIEAVESGMTADQLPEGVFYRYSKGGATIEAVEGGKFRFRGSTGGVSPKQRNDPIYCLVSIDKDGNEHDHPLPAQTKPLGEWKAGTDVVVAKEMTVIPVYEFGGYVNVVQVGGGITVLPASTPATRIGRIVPGGAG